MVEGLTALAKSMTGDIAAIIPVAIPVVASMLGISIALKVFKKVTGAR